MSPNFKQKTIDTLAKRAAFHCSNPECRTSTVGPNSDPQKATSIGEAAHICGAQPGSARFNARMSDVARSEITNSIWLCRNCHRRVDRDPTEFPADLLFTWREQHERFVANELGSTSSRIRLDVEESRLDRFKDLPPIVRRIVIDQPIGWEYRLTAELMRHFNESRFRKLHDLRGNMYSRPLQHMDVAEGWYWINERTPELSRLLQPTIHLVERLNKSWGEIGESGDINEIYHTCCLIRDNLDQVIRHEEELHFARVPDELGQLVELLKNCAGSQVEKLATIPDDLDDALSHLDEERDVSNEGPLIFNKSLQLGFPDGWEAKWKREYKRVHKKLTKGDSGGSFWYGLFGFFVFWIVIIILF